MNNPKFYFFLVILEEEYNVNNFFLSMTTMTHLYKIWTNNPSGYQPWTSHKLLDNTIWLDDISGNKTNSYKRSQPLKRISGI